MKICKCKCELTQHLSVHHENGTEYGYYTTPCTKCECTEFVALALVETSRLPELQEKLAKMTAKAVKLGVAAPVMVLGQPFGVPVTYSTLNREAPYGKTQSDVAYYAKVVAVEMVGEAPKFAGWTFCATLERRATEKGSAVLVQAIPGAPKVPDAYRTAAEVCEHCGTKRMRATTYVVMSPETGEFKQVGSTCIKDFLGGMTPQALATRLDFWAQFYAVVEAGEGDDSFGFSGHATTPTMQATTVLLTAATAIRVLGFVSKAKAQQFGKLATSKAVQDLCFEQNKKNWSKESFTVLEASADEATLDQPVADGVVAYVMALPGKSDFEMNMQALVGTLEYATAKDVGLLTAAVGMYHRSLETAAVRKAEAEKEGLAPSNHIGEVGQRYQAELKLVNVKAYDSTNYYGETEVKNLVTMIDAQGNFLKWFTGYMSSEWWAVESTKLVAFTVKKHTEYDGRMETQVTRVGEPGKKKLPAPVLLGA